MKPLPSSDHDNSLSPQPPESAPETAQSVSRTDSIPISIAPVTPRTTFPPPDESYTEHWTRELLRTATDRHPHWRLITFLQNSQDTRIWEYRSRVACLEYVVPVYDFTQSTAEPSQPCKVRVSQIAHAPNSLRPPRGELRRKLAPTTTPGELSARVLLINGLSSWVVDAAGPALSIPPSFFYAGLHSLEVDTSERVDELRFAVATACQNALPGRHVTNEWVDDFVGDLLDLPIGDEDGGEQEVYAVRGGRRKRGRYDKYAALPSAESVQIGVFQRSYIAKEAMMAREGGPGKMWTWGAEGRGGAGRAEDGGEGYDVPRFWLSKVVVTVTKAEDGTPNGILAHLLDISWVVLMVCNP